MCNCHLHVYSGTGLENNPSFSHRLVYSLIEVADIESDIDLHERDFVRN